MSAPKVYAYYYPGWVKKRSFDEWELLQDYPNYFEGHTHPSPKRCYYLDNDPGILIDQIKEAKQHGIDGFIFCFYWDQEVIYLNQALEFFLETNIDFEFALMWANRRPHDQLPIPARTVHGDYYQPASERIVKTSEDDCSLMMKHLQAIFSDPRYIKISGKPLFIIFTMMDFFRSFGEWIQFPSGFLKKLFPNTHLVAIAHCAESWIEDAMQLGVDALSSYVLLPDWRGQMIQSFERQAWRACCYWSYIAKVAQCPYYPSITVGWDATPRCDPATKQPIASYPYRPIVTGNTPAAIGEHLSNGLIWAKKQNAPYVVIASWNEWTEGHFIEPDNELGLQRLKEIKNVIERQ